MLSSKLSISWIKYLDTLCITFMYPRHEVSLFFFFFSSRVLTLLLALGGMKIFLSDILILTLGSKPHHFFLLLLMKLQYIGHLMQRVDSLEKTLMLEGLGAGGEGDDKG